MAITGYGVCTWIFGNLPLDDVAGRVANLGYDGVEVLGEIEKLKAASAAQILADRGLKVMSFTPINVDLAHPSILLRRHALDYYLALLDLAAELGAPMISCHGAVGRIRPVADWNQEWNLLTEGVNTISERAASLHLRVGLELLNRYESHLLNSVEQGLRLLEEIGQPNVGLHLDSYHMNIEEANLPAAVRAAGSRLVLFHAADSNRQAVGRGHIDFAALIRALAEASYTGPIILECPGPGPDPFMAVKDESSVEWVTTYLEESLPKLRALVQPG